MLQVLLSLLVLTGEQLLSSARAVEGATCAEPEGGGANAKSLIQAIHTARGAFAEEEMAEAVAKAGEALAEAGAALAEASALSFGKMEGSSAKARAPVPLAPTPAPEASAADAGSEAVLTQSEVTTNKSKAKHQHRAHKKKAHISTQARATSEVTAQGSIVPCSKFFSKQCKIESSVWSSFISWNDINVAFRICCTSAGHGGEACKQVANEIFKDKHEDGDPDPTDEIFCDMLDNLGTAHKHWEEDRAAMNFQRVDFLQERSNVNKVDNSRALVAVQTQQQKAITDQLMDQISELYGLSPALIANFLGGAAVAAGLVAHGASHGALSLTQVPKALVASALLAVSTHVQRCA